MKLVLVGLSMAALASCNATKQTASVESANVGQASSYSCGPFAGVDEWRSNIDLKKNVADFFDNDTTTVMKLKSVVSLESLPPQTQMTFEGKDAGGDGILRLVFNLTKKRASLISISSAGKTSSIGSADCVASKK